MALTNLPTNLPEPKDDGAADHLTGMQLPNISLNTTSGESLNLSKLKGYCVIYIYPMTGRPDVALPDNWEAIPGARGCTPQSCSFRDHYQDLQKLNSRVYGLSTQSSDYQNEAKSRLHLPFDLLSDADLKLKSSLSLPTMTVENMELYKRLTLIALDSKIKKVFYPVFPPDKNIDDVMLWLKTSGLK